MYKPAIIYNISKKIVDQIYPNLQVSDLEKDRRYYDKPCNTGPKEKAQKTNQTKPNQAKQTKAKTNQ